MAREYTYGVKALPFTGSEIDRGEEMKPCALREPPRSGRRPGLGDEPATGGKPRRVKAFRRSESSIMSPLTTTGFGRSGRTASLLDGTLEDSLVAADRPWSRGYRSVERVPFRVIRRVPRVSLGRCDASRAGRRGRAQRSRTC